jgi:hypothetical protein
MDIVANSTHQYNSWKNWRKLDKYRLFNLAITYQNEIHSLCNTKGICFRSTEDCVLFDLLANNIIPSKNE